VARTNIKTISNLQIQISCQNTNPFIFNNKGIKIGINGAFMKKALVIIIIFMTAAAGYLYYDWNTKTKKAALAPSKTLFSWTDEKGVKHFTDKEPPRGAKEIEKTTGFRYVKPPLITTIKKATLNAYGRAKNALSDFFKNIFKKGSKKPEAHQ
jgi:hypothetical protein